LAKNIITGNRILKITATSLMDLQTGGTTRANITAYNYKFINIKKWHWTIITGWAYWKMVPEFLHPACLY
jgi:hypothetical protein